MSFIKAQSLFSDSLRRNKIEKGVGDTKILEACLDALKDVFGSQIEFKVKPVSISGQAIKVSVLNSVLTTKIKLQEEEVLKLTNKYCRKKVVNRLILRLD